MVPLRPHFCHYMTPVSAWAPYLKQVYCPPEPPFPGQEDSNNGQGVWYSLKHKGGSLHWWHFPASPIC